MTLPLYKHRWVPPGTIVEHRPSGTVHRVEKGAPFIDPVARIKILARLPGRDITDCVKRRNKSPVTFGCRGEQSSTSKRKHA